MKIIEGLKLIKELKEKAASYRSKVKEFCADMDTDEPAYGSVEKQRKQIDSWIQGHRDIMSEIEKLNDKILLTNSTTELAIELVDNRVVKTIAAWVLRRRELVDLEIELWEGLTNKGLKPVQVKDNNEYRIVNIRRYFDQKTRDNALECVNAEKRRIDSALEIANCKFDLID